MQSELTWTSECPTEPGWYGLKAGGVSARMKEVRSLDGTLGVFIMREFYPIAEMAGALWCGPYYFPSEPAAQGEGS